MNDTFYRRMLVLAGIAGMTGVVVGAFGAHFLKSRLAPNDIETLKTGVLYLFIHVLATLAALTLLATNENTKWLKRAAIAFLSGVCLFSGSLFIIATADLTGFPVQIIGIVTPIGGLFFIFGWIGIIIHGLAVDKLPPTIH